MLKDHETIKELISNYLVACPDSAYESDLDKLATTIERAIHIELNLNENCGPDEIEANKAYFEELEKLSSDFHDLTGLYWETFPVDQFFE